MGGNVVTKSVLFQIFRQNGQVQEEE